MPLIHRKHPGAILLVEFLQPAGITPRELDEQAGWPPGQAAEIIKGQLSVTAQIALDLARVLGTSATVWQYLQHKYDKGLN